MSAKAIRFAQDQTRSSIRSLELMLDKLKQDNRSGHQHFAGRIAASETKIGQLKTRLDAIDKRLDNFGDNLTDVHVQAFQTEFARLGSLIDANWADLNGQIQELTTRVDDHDVTLTFHGEQIAEAHDRIDSHDEQITVLKQSIKAPKWALVVALIFGVIGYVVWDRISFVDSFFAGKQNVAISYKFADSHWASLLFGIVVFLITWFVCSFFGSDSTTTQRSSTKRTSSRVSQLRQKATTTLFKRKSAPKTEPKTRVLARPSQSQEVNA